jgi:hypothetical protein
MLRLEARNGPVHTAVWEASERPDDSPVKGISQLAGMRPIEAWSQKHYGAMTTLDKTVEEHIRPDSLVMSNVADLRISRLRAKSACRISGQSVQLELLDRGNW